MISAKKQRKTIEWERLEISSRKSEEQLVHPKMGTKDRNGIDLTEAEDIKKRWQEYTEELYKKDLHDPDNHDAVITHLEPDILESEVKWALGSITRRRQWHPTPVLLPGKSHGRRSLVGCSPWGCEESDMTE